MAKRPAKSRQSASNKRDLKKDRSDLALLKRVGIIGKQVDVRNAKVGWRQRKLLNSMEGVIKDLKDGRAAVLKVGRKAAKEYAAAGVETRRDRAIIKKRQDETVRYSAKRGLISATREQYGLKLKSYIYGKPLTSAKALPKDTKTKVLRFELGNRTYDRESFVSEILERYDPASTDDARLKARWKKKRKSIGDFLRIYEFKRETAPDADEDEDV